MTDEASLRASIRGKVVSWWPMDGNLNDVKGGNNLTIGVSVAGYAPGKQNQMLLKNSIGAALLAAPFPLTTNNSLSVGGWVYYDGTAASLNLFGLSFNFDAQNTSFSLSVTSAGAVHAGSFPNLSDGQYLVEAPAFTVKRFPITVRVTDSLGNKATSDQTISVIGYLPTPGFYFIVARFIGQTIDVFVNGTLAGTTTPPMPAPRAGLVTYFQVGQQFGPASTNCGLDELFFCQAALTPEEIAYLYNDGDGRTYFDLGST